MMNRVITGSRCRALRTVPHPRSPVERNLHGRVRYGMENLNEDGPCSWSTGTTARRRSSFRATSSSSRASEDATRVAPQRQLGNLCTGGSRLRNAIHPRSTAARSPRRIIQIRGRASRLALAAARASHSGPASARYLAFETDRLAGEVRALIEREQAHAAARHQRAVGESGLGLPELRATATREWAGRHGDPAFACGADEARVVLDADDRLPARRGRDRRRPSSTRSRRPRSACRRGRCRTAGDGARRCRTRARPRRRRCGRRGSRVPDPCRRRLAPSGSRSRSRTM